MKTSTQVALAAALILCLNSAGSRAENIVGKVQVGGAGHGAAVVCLEGVKGKFDAPTKPIVIDQQDKVFVPHVVAVMKGGTVEFRNSDDFLHNTYSQSKSKSFDLHQPVKGSRSLLKTDETGVIEVRCHIHGNMQAWIVVVDNPYFAVTDSKGIFHINGVPPGTYKIKSWTEQQGFISQEVKVTGKDGATVILKYAAK